MKGLTPKRSIVNFIHPLFCLQGYKSPPLDVVEVVGVQGKPTKAFCNGKQVLQFFFDEGRHFLLLTDLGVAMSHAVTVQWM